ncbi:MAG: ATP-binding domain-containing protein [Phycisphaerales bacterium]|nr:ATP-binding domain-containing protein [Phycisphaerales bacterium]
MALERTVVEAGARLEADKARARELLVEARDRGRRIPVAVFHEDITGDPNLRERQQFTKVQKAALERVGREAFFCSVEAAVTDRHSEGQPIAFLISKARETGGVGADDESWELLSWTSPITSGLMGSDIGKTVEFRRSPRQTTIFEVKTRCGYGAILPTAQTIRFENDQESVEFADEQTLESLLSGIPAGEPTEAGGRVDVPAPAGRAFEVDRNFGLHEIIAEADAQQRFAMHLPLNANVLIEGPPGSGKTSLALMRVPCLLDGQWEQFELDRERDAPFYSESDCRILVVTEQMVQYLKRLRDSLGLNRVRCTTFADVYRKLCRDAGTLSGKQRAGNRALRRLKGGPGALEAAWAGFRLHAETLWERQREVWVQRMVEAGGPETESLALTVDRWIRRLAAHEFSLQPVRGVSLSNDLAGWLQREKDRREERESGDLGADTGLGELAGVVRRLARAFADRAGWTAQMLLTPEFERLEREWAAELGTEAVEAALDQWEEMATGSPASFDEADLAISGWLALKVFTTSEGRGFRMGAAEPTFRHLVVDEAQDLTHAHAATLPWLLDEGGTMTVVGDLRQVLHEGGGLRDWGVLDVLKPERREFDINYRQSRQLGSFVRGLYQELYGETPRWRANALRGGPAPRVVVEPRAARLAEVIAAEIREARRAIPDATVALVFDGPVKKDRLRRLQRRLEAELEGDMVDVHLTGTRDGQRHLEKTDCVHILPVTQTKGLEFPVVILADLYDRFSGPAARMPPDRRNRLYVAASRAEQWLSMVLRAEPHLGCLASLKAE